MKNRWIQSAVKNKGALYQWVLRNRPKIKQLTKTDPIASNGEIKRLALLRLRKTSWYERLSATTKRRISLALTLEKLRK